MPYNGRRASCQSEAGAAADLIRCATFALALEDGYIPDATDVYNPAALNYGNSNYMSDSYKTQINWNGNQHNGVDIRLFYVNRTPDSWAKCRWNEGEGLDFYKNSVVSGAQICYTTEALRFAQGGYLVSIVCVQWADLMICKTRALSISQQGMVNSFGNFGLFFETALVAILLYVPFLNIALGTRQIPFAHFAVPSFSFYVAIFFYDELRKIWLRNGMSREGGKLKLKGWIVQNTYY